jgi:hypothetical protein
MQSWLINSLQSLGGFYHDNNHAISVSNLQELILNNSSEQTSEVYYDESLYATSNNDDSTDSTTTAERA